jgi:hypothetical protein
MTAPAANYSGLALVADLAAAMNAGLGESPGAHLAGEGEALQRFTEEPNRMQGSLPVLD